MGIDEEHCAASLVQFAGVTDLESKGQGFFIQSQSGPVVITCTHVVEAVTGKSLAIKPMDSVSVVAEHGTTKAPVTLRLERYLRSETSTDLAVLSPTSRLPSGITCLEIENNRGHPHFQFEMYVPTEGGTYIWIRGELDRYSPIQNALQVSLHSASTGSPKRFARGCSGSPLLLENGKVIGVFKSGDAKTGSLGLAAGSDLVADLLGKSEFRLTDIDLASFVNQDIVIAFLDALAANEDKGWSNPDICKKVKVHLQKVQNRLSTYKGKRKNLTFITTFYADLEKSYSRWNDEPNPKKPMIAKQLRAKYLRSMRKRHEKLTRKVVNHDAEFVWRDETETLREIMEEFRELAMSDNAFAKVDLLLSQKSTPGEIIEAP